MSVLAPWPSECESAGQAFMNLNNLRPMPNNSALFNNKLGGKNKQLLIIGNLMKNTLLSSMILMSSFVMATAPQTAQKETIKLDV